MTARARWRRLAIFVGLNLLALAALIGLVLSPAVAFLEKRQAEIDYKFSRLARQHAALTHTAAIKERTQALLADVPTHFIHGDSPSAQSADLLTCLRQIAEAHGVVFTSFATLPSRDWSGRQLIGARVEFSGVSHTVSEILADIEAGKGFLFIDRAHFASARTDEVDETVSISIDVYGAAG